MRRPRSWPVSPARLLAAGFAALLAIALSPLDARVQPHAGHRAALPATPKVAVWRIADADTEIWMLGTIHALPPGIKWRSPAIDKILASADGLVLESVDDPTKTMNAVTSLGIEKGLPPLVERADPAKRAELAKMVKETGVPAAVLDGMKTWAATILLVGASTQRVGASAGNGIETELSKTFTANGRPITGLETAMDVFGALNTMSEAEQRRFLNDSIDTPAEDQSDFRDVLRAWLTGDADKIGKLLEKKDDLSPVVRDLLLHRRNIAWADWLAKRLAQPGGKLFVAVGAGHLAGPDSLQHLLEAKGIKVTRVN
jgi:uncharacterized protein YbaP (TraB family)